MKRVLILLVFAISALAFAVSCTDKPQNAIGFANGYLTVDSLSEMSAITSGPVFINDKGAGAMYLRNGDRFDVVGSIKQGANTPVGAVLPEFVGQFYLDTVAPDTLFLAIGATNTDWLTVGPE